MTRPNLVPVGDRRAARRAAKKNWYDWESWRWYHKLIWAACLVLSATVAVLGFTGNLFE